MGNISCFPASIRLGHIKLGDKGNKAIENHFNAEQSNSKWDAGCKGSKTKC